MSDDKQAHERDPRAAACHAQLAQAKARLCTCCHVKPNLCANRQTGTAA